VVGLAVGFLLGGAVSKMVASLVNDIISPLLAWFMNDIDNLKGAYFQLGAARVMWGNFLSVMIDFVVVALVVYFGVKLLKLDRLDKKKK
jgi:large conductance mechanosensitive channel